MARPTKYRKEMCEEVVKEMAQGASKEAAAGALGIHKDTLYEWIKRHKAFSDAIREGEARSRAWWEKLGRAAALGKVPGFQGTPWIFSMKNIHGWTDKQEITGPSGGPIKTETKVLTVVGVKGGKDAGSGS